MTKIEAFVDSVYQNVGGNKKEIQELKAEMTSHLMESVYELKLEGKTDQEAIELAIERFGGEKEMRSIVGQLFKAQKIFAKWMLYIAVSILFLSLFIFGLLYIQSDSDANELSVIATHINDVLENKEVISPDMGNEIERFIESTNQIASVEIIDVSDIKKTEDFGGYGDVFNYVEQAKPDYQYKRIVWAPEWLSPDFYDYGNGDNQWYVNMKHRSFGDLESLVLFVGLAIYWTLFSIWAVINAYHQKRLNIGWTLTFIVFNIVGYLVYSVVGKQPIRRLLVK